MRYIADLHLHSRFAQACSKDISIKTLEKWAKVKGVDLLGTGDFTHPEWIKELQAELVEERDGIYYTKTGQAFMLTTEVSLIYTHLGKGRRVHMLLWAPSFAIVEQITKYFLSHGRIDYDGRPIFKIPVEQLVEDLKAISDDIEIIPAHAWTPWFSLFGSKSGYDSITEAFGDQVRHIYAIETGLSSDIEMNDRLDQLEGFRFVSFSDSHSFWPWRLGREATIFELEQLSYKGIINAVRTGTGFWGTIEVEPSYGKYHADGHRTCNVVMTPEKTKKAKGICPVCKKPMTIGVDYRVEELADRAPKEGHSQRFYKLLPLHEILSLALGKGLTTKTVWNEYWKILEAGKHEYEILIETPREKLLEVTREEIADAIIAVREGKVTFTPGYDGVYGVPEFPNERKKSSGKSYMARQKKAKRKSAGQKGLGDFFG